MLKLLQLKIHINIYFTGFCMQTYFACIPVSFVTAYKIMASGACRMYTCI